MHALGGPPIAERTRTDACVLRSTDVAVGNQEHTCPSRESSPMQKAKYAHLPSATSNPKLAKKPSSPSRLVEIPVLKAFCPGFQGTICEMPAAN